MLIGGVQFSITDYNLLNTSRAHAKHARNSVSKDAIMRSYLMHAALNVNAINFPLIYLIRTSGLELVVGLTEKKKKAAASVSMITLAHVRSTAVIRM